jgi:hypothetical protein
MSKKNNVNPNHYKVRGRDRQGEDILQEVHQQEYAQAQVKGKRKDSFFPAPAGITNNSEDGEINKAAEPGK